MSTQKKVVTTNTSAPPKKGSSKTVTETIIKQQPQKHKQGKNNHQGDVRGGKTTRAQCAREYSDIVLNPFDHRPCPLGLGTMVPTETYTVRMEVSDSADSNGQLEIMLKPNFQAPFATKWPAGAWVSRANPSAVNVNQFSQGRFIASGIRITPNSSNNDKPSRIFCIQFNYDHRELSTTNLDIALAAITSIDIPKINGDSGTLRTILPSGGKDTFQGVLLPTSAATLEFSDHWLKDSGVNATALSYTAPVCGPVLFVSILGPASMQYFIDVVYHFEYTSGMNSILRPTLSIYDRFFTTMEDLYSAMKPYLTAKNASAFLNTYETWSNSSGHGKLFNNRISPPTDDKEEKHSDSVTLAKIDEYLSSLDLSRCSDTERQHLLHIATLFVDESFPSPVIVNRDLSSTSQKESRIPILRKP